MKKLSIISRPNERPKAKAYFLIGIVILLSIFIGIFSSMNTTQKAAEAFGTGDITDLDGNGLVEGANDLDLSVSNTVTYTGSGLSDGGVGSASIHQSSMNDLYINGNIYANRGSNPYPFVSGDLSPNARFYNDGSTIRMESYPKPSVNSAESNQIIFLSNISLSDSIIDAIKDPMVNVNAAAIVQTQAMTHLPPGSFSTATVSATWAPNGSVSGDGASTISNQATVSNAGNHTSGYVSLSTVGSNPYLRFQMDQFSIPGGPMAPESSWGVTDPYRSALSIKISRIYIQIDITPANVNQLSFDTPDIESDVEIIEAERRYEKCQTQFVKPGDIVVVSTTLMMGNQFLNMEYDEVEDEFLLSFGMNTVNHFFRYKYFPADINGDTIVEPWEEEAIMQVSTIDWDYSSYAQRIFDDDFDVTGQTAKFLIMDVPTNEVRNITFRPFLRTYVEGNSDRLFNGHEIILKGDSTPPTPPEFEENDPFNIEQVRQGEWLSQGFEEGDTPEERGVYVEANLTYESIDIMGSGQVIYYTTDGTNPFSSPTRRVLLDDIDENFTNTKVTLFFPMPGTLKQAVYTLSMASADFVGNRSMINSYIDNKIHIDCTDYDINIFFGLGDIISPANTPAVAALGTIELGTYKSEYDKDYKKVSSRSYRRGSLIYIKLIVNINSNYRLFQYYNSGRMDIINNEIDYGNFAQGNYGNFHFRNSREVGLYVPNYEEETSIKLDDDMLSNLNSLNFYFLFKQQLPIFVGATETVYDGTSKAIGQPSTTLSGIDIVTYYKADAEEEFTSTDRFVNAGTYYYKCVIVSANYFGFKEGEFIIRKADPFITGLEVQDIVYENSMDAAVIRCENTDPNTPEQPYNLYSSSDGKVTGLFRITSPSEGSGGYIMPTQGEKAITVTFYPGSEYENNYNFLSFQTTLYVDYSTNLQIEFQESSFSYTFQRDVRRYASATTYPSNQHLIYEYKREGEPDSAYTTQAPIDAGFYEVRVRTDLNLSNYNNMRTTEGEQLKFIIYRLPLEVVPTPAQAYYQYDYDPMADAYLVTQAGSQYVPIDAWRYEYLVDGNWVDERPVDTGIYDAMVIIDSLDEYGNIIGNYEGEAMTTLTILKGNADSTTSFSVTYPAPINNPSINGHISYGQTLDDINLTSGFGYRAQYSFKKINEQGNESYEMQNVEGQFIVANRMYNPSLDPSIAAFVEEMKNTVLDVGRYIASTAMYITFVPDDRVNFDISTSRINVTVVKATPSFNNLIIEPLTYGDLANDIVILGFNKQEGDAPTYTIDEIVTIDDQIINPMVNSQPITGTLIYIDEINKALAAGERNVAFRFIPDDEENVRIVSLLYLSVTIEKAMLDMEFSDVDEEPITRKYGYNFSNPVVDVYRIVGDTRVLDSSFRTDFFYYDSEENLVNMTAYTPTGNYTVRVVVMHNNFQGEISHDYVVQKASPILHTSPVAGTIRYNMDMSGVNLIGGRMQHPTAYYTVEGHFAFDGEPDTPLQVGNVNYDIIFYPNDDANYETVHLTIPLRVQKALAQVNIGNLQHTYTGQSQQITYQTSVVIRTEGEEEYYVDLTTPGEEMTEMDRYLSVTVTYDLTGDNIPVNAGTYIVLVRINDINYEGEKTEEYIINQASAVIYVEEESKIQAFNNGVITLDARAEDMNGDSISVLINQTFTNYDGEQMNEAPRYVGVYDVVLEVRDNNYEGVAISSLTITVAQISILNNNQTYGINLPVAIEYMPSSAHSIIRYQRVLEGGGLGDIYDSKPLNAGVYKIMIDFPGNMNNGYQASFENQLVINKAVVNLSYSGEFSYNYLGEPRAQLANDVNRIRVSPNPLYTLNREYEFYDDIIEDFTFEEPLDVGSYVMRVNIIDQNYTGSSDFVYTITKSTPVINMHPVIAPLTYTDDGVEAVIDGGEVIFNHFVVSGSYQLVENTMTLEVGEHSVMYKFTPSDTHNYNEIFGMGQVIIMQKDLSEFIVFYGQSVVEYNAQSHYISAGISTGENPLIEIFYNRSKSAPRERGIYTVTAEILDKNYMGDAEWGEQLRIIEGTPVIVKPQLTNINVNDVINNSDIIGGYAYINGTGEFVNGELVPGTATQIPGTFSFINPNKVMTKANFHDVRMSFKPFKPFAVNNFSNVAFDVTIRVIGEDPTIGEVSATATQMVYYGQNLENFELSFDSISTGDTEGTLIFADVNTIPEVGGTVTYRFIPNDMDTYNIVEGEVEVDIKKTNPTIQKIEARAFYGQTLREAIFDAQMVNLYNADVTVDGEFELISVDGFDIDTVLTVNNLSGLFDLTTETPQFTAAFLFTSNNYNDVNDHVTISVYHKVDEQNIYINNTSKPFDAMPLTVGDMAISASHTGHPLFNENFVITVYDENGLSDGINVGDYFVVIEIIDGIYYGIKTVDFEITKADISEYITLSNTTATFGETIVKPHAVLSEEIGDIAQSNFVIEFKLASENENAYNQTMPSQAGNYDVRVSVINNSQFTAEKVLNFEIHKRSVNVEVSSMRQTYGNVRPLNVTSVGYDLVPTVTYYSSSYTRKQQVPTEAGMYTARVEVVNRNYIVKSGNNNYVEVSFEITQASLTLITKPFISDIVYGQSLRDSSITGGNISYGEGVSIVGRYTFQNPSFIPNAGINLVNLLFTPYNKNFAPMTVADVEINVARANAEIMFTNLKAVYDKTNKRDLISYVADNDADWQIDFMRQGVVVEPINAGTYQIRVRILSDNYQMGIDTQGNPIIQRLNAATFVIDKATMQDYTSPRPTPISYGQSLAYSTLNSNEFEGYGMVSYYGIDGFVEGSFQYINSGRVLGNSGWYIVDIRFNPDDSANYNSFTTNIEIEVKPAYATISVKNNTFTYGEAITLPTFTTNPANLSVEHNIDILGQIVDCGTYKFRAWITSQNYDHEENYFDFNIVILKKEIGLEFVQDGQPIEKYFTTYQKILNAKARVNIDDIVIDDLYSSTGLHIDVNIILTYYTVTSDSEQPVREYDNAPSDIGSYRVVAIMNHSNYYGTQTIYYDITLGEIEEVNFDIDTLERQVYGSVVPPTITTKPTGVSYYIVYQGYGQIMPTDAGTYNIVVYFNDSNFLPRQVSAMFRIRRQEIKLENIQVSNKVYDGVATLDIDAKMNGVFLGDEVKLNLKARTKDGKVNPGRHNVEITEYTISGLSAKNYQLVRPYYTGSIEIYERKISDSKTQSYVTSSQGFTDGVTVEFAPVMSPYNQENIITNMLGQKAMVQSFTIKENGHATTLDERVKVYIKIPDEFLDAKNLIVEGVGKLADRQVNFVREGEYITFYTDSSGEVVFSTNDFSYWSIGIVAVVVVIVLSVIFLFMLNPRHKRRHTANKDPIKAATDKIRKGGMYR